MEKEKIKCLICGKEVTNNGSYIGSHVKRIHNLLLNEYVEKYYKNLTPNFKKEKCGFCNKNAVPNFIINHKNKTYELNYDKGYFCQTDECRNNISIKILNKEYDSKTYEHIGSNSLYLSLLYKKPIKEIKYKKSKGFREFGWISNINNYIEKYGEKEGRKKYEERNKKISKANTLSWYKEKYGEEEGIIKYEIFRRKKHKHLGASKSIASKKINKILEKNNIKYIEEYKYEKKNKRNGSIDFYIPTDNIIIEYYGEYWHCNPNYYERDYYHKILKRYAYEIWNSDKNRIDYIFENVFHKKITILIIWESTKFTEEYFLNLLKNIKNNFTIFEI